MSMDQVKTALWVLNMNSDDYPSIYQMQELGYDAPFYNKYQPELEDIKAHCIDIICKKLEQFALRVELK